MVAMMPMAFCRRLLSWDQIKEITNYYFKGVIYSEICTGEYKTLQKYQCCIEIFKY